jgi:hypothetical protein
MNLALDSPHGSTDGISDTRLRYHLIVAWPDAEQHYEILVEGPIDSCEADAREEGETVPAESLSSACASLKNSPYCDFKACLAQ